MKRELQSSAPNALYIPGQQGRDACGVGLLARVSGTQDHQLLQLTLEALRNVTHRGAVSADGKSGDGAGILTQVPRKFIIREAGRMGALVGDISDITVGMFNLPQDKESSEVARLLSQAILEEHNLRFLGWREVPVNPDALGEKADQTRPDIRQAFVLRPGGMEPKVFQEQVYKARKAIEKAAEQTGLDIYIPSFDQKTLVYKGLMIAGQLPVFYKDLQDPDFETALALFHQRYSTNTTPDWMRAQPFRFLAHNGEINTLQGGVNWIKAMEPQFPPELVPVIWEAGSDSAKLDNVVELLVKSGRDIPHALMMLVQAASNYPDSDPKTREFYKYHGLLTPPWDGPAALAFCDGTVGGVILDRLGLRPSRYKVTNDLVIAGSEVNLVVLEDGEIIESGMLGPGQVFLVDTAGHKILRDSDVKAKYTSSDPYPGMSYEDVNRKVLFTVTRRDHMSPELSHNGNGNGHEKVLSTDLVPLQRAFGFTHEDVRVIINEMAESGADPVFSMGDDTPPAVMSNLNRAFYAYFKQYFAQVTNPPIDSTREHRMMSLDTVLGPMPNMLDEVPLDSRRIDLKSPILDSKQIEEIAAIQDGPLKTVVIDTTFKPDPKLGPDALKEALTKLNLQVEAAVKAGAGNIILSDEKVDASHVSIPMLLALGGVHHHLVRSEVRDKTSLIVKTGEAWDVHHFAALLGYGANAINPYLAVTTAKDSVYQDFANRLRIAKFKQEHGQAWKETPEYVQEELLSIGHSKAIEAEEKYFHAIDKGLLKIMAKMGIPTVAGYRGAQIFEALGIASEVVDICFTDTTTRIGGLRFKEIAEDVLERHTEAFGGLKKLPHHGLVRPFQQGGEYHANNHDLVNALQQAANSGSREDWLIYRSIVENRPAVALRDLMEFRSDRAPIPLADVEPMENIRRRFITTAMSLGALSPEAHRVLAVAMNRIGGRSNSGEGGENPLNYILDKNGDLGHNKIKQVASARFGVTAEYLMQAEEIEIKMAQGSKPGEGGQIPGSKVTELIASLRFAVPGVGLISPPPHHDIYSIEDLAQLIYDLKMINPKARIGVKLVSEPGVGTIAAGVAKAYADYILISGPDGGTGASPLSSIKNAGSPWELGLSETQQTLAGEDLRGRVTLRTDGGLKTGRDVVTAAMLGAEEFGFGTQAVIAMGCDMARACHLNICPTGIATQDEKLRREKFKGTPDQVINYFTLVAEDVREHLAELGYASFDEIIGRPELLRRKISSADSREALIDISPIIMASDPDLPRMHMVERNDRPEDKTPLTVVIAEAARESVVTGQPIQLSYNITNSDRTVGSRLSGEIAALHGLAGLEPGTINIDLKGSAGQSLGAWLARGVTLKLVGEANDSVGKGLCGGEIIIYPSSEIQYQWGENTIIGNTVLYGATSGQLFAAGRAGERFAIRNSGATAVVEGAGDNACEYMTGGMVAVLGRVGNNFAAGKTGGVAYIMASDKHKVNTELVEVVALDESDKQVLIGLVEKHFDKTGSPTALRILNNVDSLGDDYVKVTQKKSLVVKAPEQMIVVPEILEAVTTA